MFIRRSSLVSFFEVTSRGKLKYPVVNVSSILGYTLLLAKPTFCRFSPKYFQLGIEGVYQVENKLWPILSNPYCL